MKDDLILKTFTTEYQVGTMGAKEISTFFGGKMIDVEDYVSIESTAIQYYELYNNTGNTTMNGYQYYDFDTQGIIYEAIKLQNLFDVKNSNHTIGLLQQSDNNLRVNTRWEININIKKILQTYLFLKIKERRTFKCVRPTDLISKDINQSIYDYISYNVIDRFGLDHIDFYVKYYDIIQTNTIYSPVGLQYNPIYDLTIAQSENKITNLNIITDNYLNTLNDVRIMYNQIKPSDRYRFDYYFNLFFKKI
jgi:hypothetical protein